MLNELCKKAYENAKSKGWWDEERSFGEQIALMHSELSEALEEYRKGHDITEGYYTCKNKSNHCHGDCNKCIDAKPEGIPVELADVLIRIFDTCGRYGIDLDRAVEMKMKYNETRPYKHGGKKI